MVQRYDAGREFHELLIGNYDLYERADSKPRQMTLMEMFGEGESTDSVRDEVKESIVQKKRR